MKGEIIKSVHEYSYPVRLGKTKGEEQSRLVVNEGMAPRSGTGNRSLFHLCIRGTNLIEIFMNKKHGKFFFCPWSLYHRVGGREAISISLPHSFIINIIVNSKRLSIPHFHNIQFRKGM